MDTQVLYEIAEREIRTGLYDRELMRQARQQANGIQSVAEEIYWRLRSEAIRAEATRFPNQSQELYVRELRARIDQDVRSRKLRSGLIGWMWVAACFAG